MNSVEGARRKPWFKGAAEKWIRWTRHQGFPKSGLPHEKILFAIQCHCQESGKDEFFLGSRDAATVAGNNFRTAAKAVRKLVADGALEKVGKRSNPRHAQTYRLK